MSIDLNVLAADGKCVFFFFFFFSMRSHNLTFACRDAPKCSPLCKTLGLPPVLTSVLFPISLISYFIYLSPQYAVIQPGLA